MAVLYGAQLYQPPTKEINARYDMIGTSSEVIAAGDVVCMASGNIEVVDATTDAIAGVAITPATAAQNDGTKYIGFIPADENYTWLMGTNSDLTDNATNYGTFYGLTTGGTGTQQVDVTSGVTTTTSRQVMIVKVDPRGTGGSGSGSGLREVLVKFVRIPEFNGAFN